MALIIRLPIREQKEKKSCFGVLLYQREKAQYNLSPLCQTPWLHTNLEFSQKKGTHTYLFNFAEPFNYSLKAPRGGIFLSALQQWLGFVWVAD